MKLNRIERMKNNSKFIVVDYQSFCIFDLDLENFIKFFIYDFLGVKDKDIVEKTSEKVLSKLTPHKVILITDLLQRYNLYIVYNVPKTQNTKQYLDNKINFSDKTINWVVLNTYEY